VFTDSVTDISLEDVELPLPSAGSEVWPGCTFRFLESDSVSLDELAPEEDSTAEDI
jgi:hypothetical protein